MAGNKDTKKKLPKKNTRKSTKSTSRRKNSKKKNELTNKKVLVCGILIALAIILIGITFSYAFWTATATQIDENVVNTGCFNITLNDKDIDGNVTNIILDNTYPINDEKGLLLKPYEFTITNTCSIEANIFVYLHTLSDSTIDSNYIKYHLHNVTSNYKYGPDIVGDLGVNYLANDINEIVAEKLGDIDETYELNNISILPNKSVTFNLRMWIDYDAPNSIMGETYNAAVSIFATTPE